MPATLQYPAPPPVQRRPAPVRYRLTLDELLRRAAASVEDRPAKVIMGTFRLTKKGRPLTRVEKGLMMLMAAGLGVAIWLHAQPVPVSAHTAYYQSLAASARLEAGAPQPLAESALREIGRDWRPATLFASMQPAFWRRGAAIHPNTRAAGVEQGLARLAEHGPVLNVLTFPAPTAVETEVVAGNDVLAARVAGQLELADGTVTRFTVHLLQDATTRQWGLVELAIPGFLP